MSFDSTVAHLRSELARGVERRRRFERRRRAFAATGLGLVMVVVAGTLAVARVRSDDTTQVATTAISAEQRSVCDAYLDYRSATAWMLPYAAARAAVIEGARRLPGDDPLAVARNLAEPDDPISIDVFPTIEQACRDLGHPDFNPVYVPAPPPAAATDPVDASPAWDRQPFRDVAGSTTVLPLAMLISGREMSPVQVAVTDAGAYVAEWSYLDASGRRIGCLAYGTSTFSGVGSPTSSTRQCGPGEPRTANAIEPNAMQLTSGIASPYATIATSPEIATVVARRSEEAVMQQPVLGRAVILWQTAATDPVVVRGYDASGRQVSCTSTSVNMC